LKVNKSTYLKHRLAVVVCKMSESLKISGLYEQQSALSCLWFPFFPRYSCI
jgi:hypothetical protein